MKYGLQLYSVCGHMENSVEDTLRKISSFGYSYIEPAGYYNTSAEDFREITDKYKLETISTHSHLGEIYDDRFSWKTEFLKKIGCKYYVIPNSPIQTKEEIDKLVDRINEYLPKLKSVGLELVYHNHHREFLPNEDGQIPIIELQKRTEIKFEIDVYWVYRAGINPIFILEQLKDRIPIVHLKDGTEKEGAPIGKGNINTKEIVDWCIKNNKYIIVENEPKEFAQMEEAKECIDFLKSLV